jgi:hypothetical protein
MFLIVIVSVATTVAAMLLVRRRAPVGVSSRTRIELPASLA